MASLRASLLTQLPTMSTSSCSRNGLSTAGGGLKEACSSVPKACKNLGHVLELNRKGWKSEGPTRSRGLTTSSRKKALSSSSSQRQMRPGCSRNSLFVAPDPSLVLPRQESAPTVMFQQLRHCQQQSQFPSLFVVEVIRLPLESPDVKPSLKPSAPYIPGSNLPTPSPTTTPPVIAPGETPTEFPAPSTNFEPEVVPSFAREVPTSNLVPEFSPTTIPTPDIPATPAEFSPGVPPSETPIPPIPTEIPLVSLGQFPVTPTPTEVPSPGGPPEFKPIATGGVSSDVDASGVPRGPPISPPNIPPNLPPGTPPSILSPNMLLLALLLPSPLLRLVLFLPARLALFLLQPRPLAPLLPSLVRRSPLYHPRSPEFRTVLPLLEPRRLHWLNRIHQSAEKSSPALRWKLSCGILW